MGLYDTLFDTHVRLRSFALLYRLKSQESQEQIFKAWREFAVISATDFFDKQLSEHELDDAVSEVLLDLIIGPDAKEAQCTEEDLAHAMTFDAKLHRYVKRRLSDEELFYMIKRKPALPHRDLLQRALDAMPTLLRLQRAA